MCRDSTRSLVLMFVKLAPSLVRSPISLFDLNESLQLYHRRASGYMSVVLLNQMSDMSTTTTIPFQER